MTPQRERAEQVVIGWMHTYVAPSPFAMPTIPERTKLVDFITSALDAAVQEERERIKQRFEQLIRSEIELDKGDPTTTHRRVVILTDLALRDVGINIEWIKHTEIKATGEPCS